MHMHMHMCMHMWMCMHMHMFEQSARAEEMFAEIFEHGIDT